MYERIASLVICLRINVEKRWPNYKLRASSWRQLHVDF